MIKLFAYENQQGIKSIKIVGIVGETATNFGGISLGKVLFNSDHTLDEVLDDLNGYTVLDHLPGRGEGLLMYGDCYKNFRKSNIYCQLGELDPAKLTAADLEKTIRFVKNMPEDKQDELADILNDQIESGARWDDPGYISFLPAEIVEVIAAAGSGRSQGSAAQLIAGGTAAQTVDEGVQLKYPFVIIKQVDGEWWYHGADDSLDAASRTLFYLASGRSCEMARIKHITTSRELNKLRREVNNLPDSLTN